MASEVIKLNLIPTGPMPVFHASQFDTGRLITCELYRGEDAYDVPAGYTVELHCRKVDNNIVTLEASQVSDNVVKFSSTEQLTACNGSNLCEVALLDEGYRIGTLNFILEVEIDPLKGGITSTSEIHNLESQVEEITTEIIGENYYDKSEVDDLLAEKADASSVYTKSETDTKLALKANTADVYTKSQTDSLLSSKADSSSVYTKSQTDILLNAKADVSDLPDMDLYYTKTATDTLLAAKADADTVTAALATKADKSDTYTKAQVDSALALKANAADVYTKAETDAKIEEAIEEILPVDTAGPSAIANFTTGLALPLVNCSVGITATGGNGTPDNPNTINGYTEANITANGDTVTVDFGQTVYGGVLDVTRGKLHVTWSYFKGGWSQYNASNGYKAYSHLSLSPAKTTYGPGLSSMLNEFGSFSSDNMTKNIIQLPNALGQCFMALDENADPNDVEVAYELATPFDIDLTPEVISAVVGTNNVYSDTNGDTTVKFKDTIQNYIDKKVTT